MNASGQDASPSAFNRWFCDIVVSTGVPGLQTKHPFQRFHHLCDAMQRYYSHVMSDNFLGSVSPLPPHSSQISQSIRQISHNAPFCDRNVHTCAHFCHKMVHCGIWGGALRDLSNTSKYTVVISYRLNSKWNEMLHMQNTAVRWSEYEYRKCNFKPIALVDHRKVSKVIIPKVWSKR